MARNLFPIDRTALVLQGPYEPVLTPPATGIQIFTDSTGTTLASIQTPSGTAIANSTVYTANGLIPEFLGPDDSVRLYGRVVGTTDVPMPLFAQIVAGGGGGGSGSYVHTQTIAQTVWTVTHNLGRRPAAVSVFSADYLIQWDEFIVSHVDVNNLSITTDSPIAGVALIGG